MASPRNLSLIGVTDTAEASLTATLSSIGWGPLMPSGFPSTVWTNESKSIPHQQKLRTQLPLLGLYQQTQEEPQEEERQSIVFGVNRQ